MTKEDLMRRLSAILSADVEGYSLLMRDDEEATVRRLITFRTVKTHLISQYRDVNADLLCPLISGTKSPNTEDQHIARR